MNLKCSVSLNSVTYANKAQRLLAVSAIYSEIIKIDRVKSESGCTYGIAFPCDQKENVYNLLKNAGLKYKIITDSDGTKEK